MSYSKKLPKYLQKLVNIIKNFKLEFSGKIKLVKIKFDFEK